MKKQIFKILAGSAFVFCLLTSCDSSMYTVSAQLNEPVYERPVSPGSGYVWVSGDWVWSGSGYTYQQGYWSRPRNNRVWVAGTWEQRNNGYRWRRGHWN